MSINHIKTAIQKKGWYFCLSEAYKRLFPIRWVRNLKIIGLIHEWRSFSYLKRKYEPSLLNFHPDNVETQDDSNKRIWVLWLQGEENAPVIVKKCIQSIRDNAGNHEVCVLTNDNIPSYITVPSYISDKLKKKKMQFATYSDYIRVALLEKYGGIWIDATVLLTSPIPEEIWAAPLFCFQKSCLYSSPILLSSWFLAANAHNSIIQQTKFLFEQYWQKENTLRNYLLFHLLFSLVVNATEENRLAFKAVPYWNNVDVHYLQFCLFDSYNEKLFEQICKKSFAHKLTYKFQDESKLSKSGTFYQHIIHS